MKNYTKKELQSTVKGGITIHELENRLSEHTQVVDDKTLDSEEIHNWGADNVTEYKKAQNEIDKIKYKGKGWEIYGWYDVSSFDYWIIKQEEQNYIQITIKFKNETVKEEEVDKIADALDSALADADRITNKYNYNPSKFAKGSTVNKYKNGGGVEWDKDSDSIRTELGEFRVRITPQMQKGYYDVYVSANKKEIGKKYDVYGIANAKDIALEMISNSNKYAKGSTVKGEGKSTYKYYKVPNEQLWAIQECNSDFEDGWGSTCVVIGTRKSEAQAIDHVKHLTKLQLEADSKYKDGGKIDINELNMPVIRTQFEDEEYEFKDGGEVGSEDVLKVAKAIFDNNNKKGKIKTSFGDKTFVGLKAMIENTNYDSEEIASSIFSVNEKKGKISTSFGDKYYGGLLAMINHSRANKLKYYNLGQMAEGGTTKGFEYSIGGL